MLDTMSRIIESTLRNEARQYVLHHTFHEYLPNFSGRFRAALQKPPMGMLYQEELGWNPIFTKTLQRVDEVCVQQEICAHGAENHLLYVAQNAFALSNAIPEEYRSTVLGDGDLAFVALTHDLGYAHDEVVWQGKEAYQHEAKSLQWVNRLRESQTISITSPTPIPHLNHFDENSYLLKTAILSNTNHNGHVKHLAQQVAESPTPEGICILSFFLADKLDFFRANRVEGLKPSFYEDNPYFFLADAVESYSITSDPTHVYYTVKMKEPETLQRDSSVTHGDFAWWKSQVEIHYGWIFDLGNTFGEAIGKKFVVQQADP